jgi:predicted RNA methylase
VSRSDGPDRYDLYEAAAQSPEQEAKFLRAVHGGSPRVLGEDFCGSGAICREWLGLDLNLRAVCVDMDDDALDALRARATPEALARMTIVKGDVLDATERVDVLCALNFPVGYWHTREDLVRYLTRACERLTPGGVFVCDIYGGANAFVCGDSDEELRGGVRYTWEQRFADPTTGRVVNAMHFSLPDGREIRDAFTYDWRLWSIPELRDAMRDAGFASTEVHDRLGDAVDGEGNLLVRPVRGEELDDTYVVYIVARKRA